MIEEIRTLLETTLAPEFVDVTSDGSHFQIVAVSSIFQGLRSLQRQQKVYALVSDKIADGSIHALSIKAYTPAEWKQASKFQLS